VYWPLGLPALLGGEFPVCIGCNEGIFGTCDGNDGDGPGRPVVIEVRRGGGGPEEKDGGGWNVGDALREVSAAGAVAVGCEKYADDDVGRAVGGGGGGGPG
jgi:hypothetical protein